MTTNNGQKFLAWGILLLCLAAIPAGLMGRSNSSSDDKATEKEGKKFSFLSRKDRIILVKIDGTIQNDEGEGGLFPNPNSCSHARKTLRKAVHDEHIKAVLLRINSPGGTVAMSQEISDAVKELREHGKPVVVSMGDVAASGGYYIASAADKIYASPGTLTGSIGVIMHLMNLSEVEKKIGVVPFVIKSGQFKDIGSMDRAPTKEEIDLLQGIIMDSYDQFVTAVADGRKMDKEQVKKLADGRIYSGRQALKVKLVDAIGGYEEAMMDIKKICKEKYNQDLVVDEGRSLSSLASLLEAKISVPQSNVLKGLIPESMNPKFTNMPLWMME